MWKYKKGPFKNTWQRPCSHCHGLGVEEYEPPQCSFCPWTNVAVVEHPENTDLTMDYGIAHRIVICNACKAIWRVYVELGDDSWDVPAPERLLEIPSVEEPKQKG